MTGQTGPGDDQTLPHAVVSESDKRQKALPVSDSSIDTYIFADTSVC